MKYKLLRMAAIFFWPIFTGQGGGAMAPLAPPPLDPLLYLSALLSHGIRSREWIGSGSGADPF